jgi:hypothetical protein
MQQVGHTDPTTPLQIYAQVMKRRERKAASRLDRLISAAEKAEKGRNRRERSVRGIVAGGPSDLKTAYLQGRRTKPGRGLEPLTPSLPWRCSTN